jgi:hypothetical protein
LVEQLRTALYPRLAPIANGWHERMQIGTRFPADHADFLSRCHAAGQKRPTPLLLRYGRGDYNSLHQDLYGEHVFPLQAAVLLSRPGERDFRGGNRADRAAAKDAIPRLGGAAEGDAVLLFAVNSRPHRGTRGDYPGQAAPRGQLLYDQGAPHAGNHLPRRPLI